VYELHERTKDDKAKARAIETLKKMTGPRTYPAAVVKKSEELSKLRSTGLQTCDPDKDGTASVNVRLAGNGTNFLVLEPAK
jgi:hypothetical protein